jgi:hypothetical protein
MTQLPEDQPGDARDKQDRQRLHRPERVAQPVPFLTLAEHHLPTNYGDHQQRQANAVEAERSLPQASPMAASAW